MHDEGRSHAGAPAIEAWWREAKAKYQHAIEPLEAGAAGEAVKVRARVTGRFAVSPVTLTFAFRLEDHRIVDLEIGA